MCRQTNCRVGSCPVLGAGVDVMDERVFSHFYFFVSFLSRFAVALLVPIAGCSLDEKVKFASENIYPKGVVKYIIVDSDRSLRSLSELQPAEDPGEGAEGDVHDGVEDYDLQSIFAGYGASTSTDWLVDAGNKMDSKSVAGFPQAYSFLGTSSGSNSLGVMHVSTATYYDLVALVREQSPEKRDAGGPRVILDGGWRVGNREVIVWLAVSALLSACACTFLLVVHNGSIFWFQQEEATQQHQHPPRPQRRRLTREQVRRILPPYVFDGVGLQPHFSSNHPPSPLPPADAEGTPTEGLLATASRPEVPQPVELCCCSICLDDYEVGDKLRCLPCNHAFHYRYAFSVSFVFPFMALWTQILIVCIFFRCIGRWLAERSATCPLCKTDIWEEEEDDSSDEGEEGGTPDTQGASFMSWQHLVDMLSFTAEGGHANLVTVTANGAPQPGGEDFSSEPSFWRRWLLQRRGRRRTLAEQHGVTLTALTEPLLQAENGQVINAEAPVEPRPDPPAGEAAE
jgi:RING-like zinc finger